MKMKYLVLTIALFFAVNIFGQGCQPFKANRSASLAGFQVAGFKCKDPQQEGQEPIRRLSKREYLNTFKAIVGPSTYESLGGVLNGLPEDDIEEKLTDFGRIPDATHLAAYESVAKATYLMLSADDEKLNQIGVECISSPNPDEACIDRYIRHVGLRAYRRPLDSLEVQELRDKVFTIGDSSLEGAAFVVYRLLLSPDFLLHMETGGSEGVVVNGSVDLSQYEVASRLSYMLWDSPPDNALYEAAKKGELTTEQQIEGQVERMMQDERLKEKLRRFFVYYLHPEAYSAPNYPRNYLKDITDLGSLNVELERELFEYIDHIIWEKKGSFTDLITNSTSFARTPAAADFYGHEPAPDGSSAQMGAGRTGLLLRAPVLVSAGAESRPILRGVKFRHRFLCDDLGAPSGVTLGENEFSSIEAMMNYSTRERTEGITRPSSCMGCHSNINPIGFALEGFDSLGRVRSKEEVYDLGGEVIAEHPVDSHVTGLNLESDVPDEARNGVELVSHIARGTKAPACFTRRMFRFFKFQQEQPQDGCQLGAMYTRLESTSESEGSILEAFKAMVVNQNILKRQVQ